jgi:hypothetical protein
MMPIVFFFAILFVFLLLFENRESVAEGKEDVGVDFFWQEVLVV